MIVITAERDDYFSWPILSRARWKHAFLDQGPPVFDAVRKVDAQHIHSGATDGCPAGEQRAVPCEMLVPVVLAWIEEWCVLIGYGINPGDVGPFEGVAVEAGKGQILCYRLTMVVLWSHIIDAEREWVVLLG